jgi:TRAP transporter TAXI family solute receptor
MKKIISCSALILLLLAGCKTDKKQFISIGTGGVTGVYYPTGGAIARIINNKADIYGIKATVESTGGSVFNINGVLGGDLDFGIAQSDRQYQAYHGLAEWQDAGRQEKLRSVFAIHPESITLVASAKSGISSVHDLRDKKVNLGNAGSGQLQNSRDIIDAIGLSEQDILGEYVKAVEAPGLLQDERIDAFFFTVGHPNGTIKEATSGRIKVRIVPISGEKIEAMLTRLPYYAASVIPHAFYPNARNESDVVTIGVKATIVTSSGVDDDVVYAVTKEVFENLDEFKSLHPALGVLTRKNMLEGLSAPIHKGALRYYREADLVQYIDSTLIAE